MERARPAPHWHPPERIPCSRVTDLYPIMQGFHTLILPWMHSFEYVQEIRIEFTTTAGVAAMRIALSPESGEPVAVVENNAGAFRFNEHELVEVCVATLSEKHGPAQLRRLMELLVQDGRHPRVRQTFVMKPSDVKWNPKI